MVLFLSFASFRKSSRASVSFPNSAFRSDFFALCSPLSAELLWRELGLDLNEQKPDSNELTKRRTLRGAAGPNWLKPKLVW